MRFRCISCCTIIFTSYQHANLNRQCCCATTHSPKVAAGGGLSYQPWVDLEQVWAAVIVVGAHRPTSPSSSSYICHHSGRAISDTHLEAGGVASACRTHYFLLNTLPESETIIGEQFLVWKKKQHSIASDIMRLHFWENVFVFKAVSVIGWVYK